MATWVIGDIHGCWETLQRLLDRIRWDPANDMLWLVGDLVNRGPSSLEVLRWAAANDAGVRAVLGNHDLHLLARTEGLRPPRNEDRLEEVMAAADRDELLAWLRNRPFIHRQDGTVMVHAGLWPGWTIDEADSISRQASAVLGRLLPLFSSTPKPGWAPDIKGDQRLAAAAAAFTLTRTVDGEGRPNFGFTGPPETAPRGCAPWFESSRAVGDSSLVIFGHWAMLGLFRSDRVICLDSGCVYGGRLTALRLGTGELIQQELADQIG